MENKWYLPNCDNCTKPRAGCAGAHARLRKRSVRIMTDKADWITQEDVQKIKDIYQERFPHGYFSDQLDDIINDMSFDPLSPVEGFEISEEFLAQGENWCREIMNEYEQISLIIKDIYTIKKYSDGGAPQLIKDLIDEGQLKPEKEDGKYVAYKTMPDFCTWCMQSVYEDAITPEFIFENVKSNCNLDTIKRYCRDFKEDK
jgi:hypothetical protein